MGSPRRAQRHVGRQGRGLNLGEAAAQIQGVHRRQRRIAGGSDGHELGARLTQGLEVFRIVEGEGPILKHPNAHPRRGRGTIGKLRRGGERRCG